MFEWLASLTDPAGFVPRKSCGEWTPDWIALHVGSDVLIWLAYLSLPVVLTAAARHPALRPFRLQLGLFAAFIFSCGTTHLLEAVIFEVPVYRLSGVVKAVTAVVSWATVFALIPAVPRVLALLPVRASASPEMGRETSRPLMYAFAVLTALLATMIRHILDPFATDIHPYMLGLLAVTLVSWYGGFGPGVVCMLVSGILATYLFVEPRRSFLMENPNRFFGLGLFFACGVAVAVLGEAQRTSRDRLRGKLTELEVVTAAVAGEKQKTEEALAALDSLFRNTPYGIAYLDADLRFVRVNESFAQVNQLPGPSHVGRTLAEVHPDFPTELLDEYRQVLATGTPLVNRVVSGPWGVWEVTAFVVPLPGARPGLGVIGVDVTDRHRAAERLAESEARFRDLADNISQFAWMTHADGDIFWYNRQWYDYTGTAPEQMEGWGWRAVHHPDHVDRVERKFRRAVAVGLAWEDVFPLRGKDGEYRWFLSRARPIRDESGAVVRWFGTNTDITEQRELVDALRESEGRLRQLAEAMPQIVYETDPATSAVVYVNRRWEEYTGTPAAQTGDLSPLVHPDDLPALAGRWEKAAATETPLEADFRLRGTDGRYRWFLTRSVPVRDEAGRVARWYGTSTDIDDQKRDQQALRDAASQLRQLTEGMPMLMWACQSNGDCDYLSRQWVEYTGRPMEEQTGYAWLNAVHPDDRSRTSAAWQSAVSCPADFEVEYRLRRHDGGYRWFAVRGIPLRDPAGRVVRWYGCCTDIEDRKRQSDTLEKMVNERTAALHRSNAELKQQKIFLDAILDNVAEGIVACDADGQLKLFNAVTRRFHGLPAESLPQDQWAEHYSLYDADGDPMPIDQLPLARAWRGETVRDAELLVRAAGQPERYILCSGEQLRSADGTRFGAVVSMRDMTERRERERQLLLTQAALIASNEELEKFAYIASHDLQEPLRKIQAFGGRLADKSREALDDSGKNYIDRMLDAAGRMRKLIEDLLAFARVTTKTASFAPVDLSAVVRDVLEDLELLLHQAGGRVEVDPLPSVPGDASQLRQVFQNLIANALKFARPGVPPVVRVSATPFRSLARRTAPTGDGWRIEVADNGIGFEAEYAERIFELFQRLHARNVYEGTGLGLAIVRKIVLRHGATIAAKSQPGAGATFVIDWPTRTDTHR